MLPIVMCLSGDLLLGISVVISLFSEMGTNKAQIICLCFGEVLAILGLFMFL